ncbi:MAG: hypothetical protein BGP03_19620 [Pseudonocardia sp. 73-21]|nr:MAG: hypothetical protein BGP03_19620 [Pseudonocardia sp. 73-21]
MTTTVAAGQITYSGYGTTAYRPVGAVGGVVVVEEPVPGVGVGPDVVVDADGGQDPTTPTRHGTMTARPTSRPAAISW